MRSPLRAPSIVLLASGALLGWTGHGLLSSTSSDLRALAPVAAFSERNSPAAAVGASGPTGDESLPLAGWYEAGFEFASRAHDLEALARELRDRNRDAQALVAAAIERASEQELLSVVGAISRLDADSIQQSHDVRRFARRLAEVAWEEGSESAPQNEVEHAVAFSGSANPDDLEEGADAVFSRDADRIYAAINLDGYDGERVMVKWFNRDTLEVESLRSFRYGRADRGVWAFVSRSTGWEPGRYQVNVYTQNDEMTLIAQGGYSVE